MNASKKKIWILDDDKSIRWVLQKALEKSNYSVLAFGNTNEAINQFNHDMPDLIVSDIKMPGETGIQFLEKVKGKFPNIPIIIKVDIAPVLPNSKVVTKALGISATIPAKIINEIPFPIPLCVICSPNHIKKIVPATIVVTVETLKKTPGLITRFADDSKPTDNP